MDTTSTSSYQPPVDKLLTYGEATPKGSKDWDNYLALGLTAEHVPELIRMATDRELYDNESDGLEIWAPIHAWRALGQLRALDAVKPLFLLYAAPDERDWIIEDLPEVFDLIGPPALPILEAYLADSTQDEWGRANVATSIANIGLHWPDMRSTSIAILSAQLERTNKNETDLSGYIIGDLIQLQAKEAAPLIEQAFADGRVDLSIAGDWVEVQAELGLLSEEQLAAREARRKSFAPSSPSSHAPTVTTSRYLPVSHAPKKTQNKRKMAKQSRKKNRKR